MKISDIVEFLQKLPQDKEVLVADYYYGDREGFIPLKSLEDVFVPAPKTEWNQSYGDVILFDSKYSP